VATLPTLPEAATFVQPPNTGGSAALAVRTFLYAVFKHARLVVALFLLIFLASAISAFVRPRTWRANTKVLVKLGETVQLAPAETPSRSIALPLNQDVVKTEAEIVRSFEVIKEAVRRLGVQPEPGVSMHQMLAGMQLALTVTPQPGSNVLRISYVGRSPDRAARMVNEITDVYLEHHNLVYQSKGMQTFYTDQLKVLGREMRAAQRRLREFLRKERVVDVDQEIDLLNKDVMQQEKSVKMHRAKVNGTRRKLEHVRTQIDQTPAQIPFSADYQVNPTVQAFKKKLADLELERSQALQYYQPTDRHVRDKEEEIERLTERMKWEKERVLSNETVRTNDLRNELQRLVFAHEVLLSDLQAREPGLRRRLSGMRKRLRELRDLRFTIVNLKQDAEQKAGAYELYRRRQEEARIQEAMKNQSMVNVSVVEHATPPLEPENGLALPLLLGLLGGLGLATGLAVAVEYLNRTLRFEEEVERYLELPVLAVIPDLESTSGIARA
jgi:uncharacterized protein involved in exopolysaccharide biosynthesis